jgi:hypothetical protein
MQVHIFDHDFASDFHGLDITVQICGFLRYRLLASEWWYANPYATLLLRGPPLQFRSLHTVQIEPCFDARA